MDNSSSTDRRRGGQGMTQNGKNFMVHSLNKYDGGRYGYRKLFLREEAEKRQEARNARTPEQQLALLDSRLGAGVGARKERERLQALIEEGKKTE